MPVASPCQPATLRLIDKDGERLSHARRAEHPLRDSPIVASQGARQVGRTALVSELAASRLSRELEPLGRD